MALRKVAATAGFNKAPRARQGVVEIIQPRLLQSGFFFASSGVVRKAGGWRAE
ncbi:hypothetical protein [Pyrobaculum aerophilum]|uniref:hypothetical protein n=1 Tax=Pyrobaculum aerophilum TaxID=13773 RepID=UPI0015F29D3B|nr:hypothetical protein [Pyrobaculum aerophilum]